MKFWMARVCLLWLLLLPFIAPRPAPGAVQSEASPYSVVLRPLPNGDVVDVTKFPDMNLELTLQKDGGPYTGKTEPTFEVFEDGLLVKPKEIKSEELSVSLTIIYDVVSYIKLDDGWKTDKGVALDLAKLVPDSGTLQYCLTVGIPHCRHAELSDPEATLGLLRDGVVTETVDEQPAPLDQVLNEALEPDGDAGGIPIIILLRDQDPELVAMKRLPTEDVLRRVNALNGAFVMIDLTPETQGDPQHQIRQFLGTMGAAYYSQYRSPACVDFHKCVKEFAEEHFTRKWIVAYDSRLYRDDAIHEVIVRFVPGGGESPAEATANFQLSSVGGEATLRPIVASVSCMILGLAPLFLVLLMVLILRPSSRA